MTPAAISDVLQVLAASGEWWWGIKWALEECEMCAPWDARGLYPAKGSSHPRARISFDLAGVHWQLARHLFNRTREDGAAWAEGVVRVWSYDDPAEALEALQARGLAPDDEWRRWWCPSCGGVGGAHANARCEACGGRGSLSAPPDLRTLAAVACLGPGGWSRAGELARVVERDAAVAWRIGRPGMAGVAASRPGVGDLRGLGVHVTAVGPGRLTLAAEGATC